MKDRIIELRKSREWTQNKFAEEMGISINYLSLIENGKKIPGDRLISDICREFGIREEWLRTGEKPKEINADIEFVDICADIGISDPKAKQAIMKYHELSPADKELWWKFIERLKNE